MSTFLAFSHVFRNSGGHTATGSSSWLERQMQDQNMRDQERLIKQTQNLVHEAEQEQEKQSQKRKSRTVWFSVLAAALAGLGVSNVLLASESAAGLGILALVLLVGYGFSVVSDSPLQKLKERLRNLRDRVKNVAKAQSVQTPFIPIGRQNKKILFGVAADLAERVGFPVGLLRLILLALIPFTSGLVIPAYFVLAIIFSQDRSQ